MLCPLNWVYLSLQFNTEKIWYAGGHSKLVYLVSMLCVGTYISNPNEKAVLLLPKKAGQSCVLFIVADGFDETETIVLLSALRRAGVCVKMVSLTSGLVGSARGVWVQPDLTLTDAGRLLDTNSINLIILPAGRQSLTKLEFDPRVHNLLVQTVARQGRIVTDAEGFHLSISHLA